MNDNRNKTNSSGREIGNGCVSKFWGFMSIIGIAATFCALGFAVLSFIAPQQIADGVREIYAPDRPTIEMDVLVPTDVVTPRPITTLSSSPTPNTSPPVQPSGYIFSDDFDPRPDEAWMVLWGELGVVNGAYSVLTPFSRTTANHVSILSDQYWGNFEVTVNLLSLWHGVGGCDVYKKDPCPTWGLGGIIVRQELDGSGIGVMLFPGETGVAFVKYDATGSSELVPGTFASGGEIGFDLASESNVIKIEADGDVYTTYVNGKRATSANILGSTVGLVGLWFQTSSQLSGTGGYTARFDDILIESIP